MTLEETSLMETSSEQPVGSVLPLLPLKNIIILPRSLHPIIVGRPQSIKAVEYALQHGKALFISTQKDPNVENPTADDVFVYGTRATILQIARVANGSLKIVVEGICRARMAGTEQFDGFLGVHYEDLPTTSLEKTVEIEALWRHLKKLYEVYTKLNDKAPTELVSMAKNIDDMDAIADTMAVHLNLSFSDRQDLLETNDLKDRLVKICTFLAKEIEILETEQRIGGRIQTQVEKSQREYYLTEKMKAIQKELGRDDHSTEINAIRAKIKTLGLSKEAQEKVDKELKRLEQMPPLSSEAVVSRTYVDWIISLPWKKLSKDTISLANAEKILNEQHAGLNKVKERIIEFLAAKKFSKNMERSPIICLVGPPGVGKTSLAQSLAQSLEREFVRISLGGIRDEAEIRGHRRTYVGALPGKIIHAMRKAKTINPVILLDEIDKITRDLHGDPAAALLEVLDPEQNKSFSDHFLEIEYDLSKVMFIATANMIEGIPYPLFDRMEIITLPGYTEDEKAEIAYHFLVPKNLKEYSLTSEQFVLSNELMHYIIAHYTKEAGVRQLERVIAKLMRKVIQQLLHDKKLKSITINHQLIKEWLGSQKFKKTVLDQARHRIGLATGLAWTEFGGDILEIETTVISGKGGLTLTGQLGEVMQESAHAALSYIRSRAAELGLPPAFYSSKDVHVHIPEGSTPKDGPSAGITMCVALISALTKNPTRPEVAMTGEVTLRGRVLAIGGLKEKLIAAQQHGMKKVIVPKENQDEMEEILKEVKLNLEIIFVETMDDVLVQALVNNPFKKANTAKNNEMERKTIKRLRRKK
ncbi:MAG TPA: endopeptidase La [Candidatus Babeliales bacterium]|nr:endopeptidase La [Candidatus Babeliales bacterium]